MDWLWNGLAARVGWFLAECAIVLAILVIVLLCTFGAALYSDFRRWLRNWRKGA